MASGRRNWLISITFIVFGGPGFVGVYLPLFMMRGHPLSQHLWLRIAGSLLIAGGLLPLCESIARFVREGRGTLVPAFPTEELVVSGFYRYVRNPMYVGVTCALAGETMLFASRQLAIYTLAVFVIVNLFVMFYEEPTLRRRYGQAYDRFRANVPRWLPRTTPWDG